MIKENYRKVCEGQDVRASLIELKKAIKEEDSKRALAYELGGDFSILSNLLQGEDPKVRKNAALILGELECEEVLPLLIEAYQMESQLFVKSDYLKAIAHYSFQEYLPLLKGRLKEIKGLAEAEGGQKHLREESSLLRSMIFQFEKPDTHKFIGRDSEAEVILLTNRCHREITAAQTECENIKMLAGGIRLETEQVAHLLPIRTYTEILFPVTGTPLLSGTPEEMGKSVAKSALLRFLKDMHKGEPPFYFRIEIKGGMPLEKRGPFIRKIASTLEELTRGQLINSATDYEIELRLVEHKSGSYIPLVKLYTIKDERFAYRKEFIPASITPVKAALIVELAKDYMREGAQILDPFCGVGTMLIERMKKVPAGSVYGIDTLEEAIEKARMNTNDAGLPAHYINRDILDFTHEYKFDEIISNMPSVSKTKDKEAIYALYRGFLEKADTLLSEEGILILYCKNVMLLSKALKDTTLYNLKEDWLIQEKEGTHLLILKKK